MQIWNPAELSPFSRTNTDIPAVMGCPCWVLKSSSQRLCSAFSATSVLQGVKGGSRVEASATLGTLPRHGCTATAVVVVTMEDDTCGDAQK